VDEVPSRLLVTSYVLLPRRPPFDLGQVSPLQLGQLVVARRDHEVIGVALPDVEAERHREQPRDARAGRRCECAIQMRSSIPAPSGLRLLEPLICLEWSNAGIAVGGGMGRRRS